MTIINDTIKTEKVLKLLSECIDATDDADTAMALKDALIKVMASATTSIK